MNGLGPLRLTHTRSVTPSWDRATASDWADVLATFPLFAGISKRRLRELARSATFAESAAGETIAFAGDRNDGLDVILGGRARTLANGGSPSRALGTGDSFSSGSATIVATSDVHVMKLPARDVEQLVRRRPARALGRASLTMRLRRLATRSVGAAWPTDT